MQITMNCSRWAGAAARCAALRLDHDLAGRLVRFDVAMRVGDLVEREHPVHVGMVGAASLAPDGIIATGSNAPITQS